MFELKKETLLPTKTTNMMKFKEHFCLNFLLFKSGDSEYLINQTNQTLDTTQRSTFLHLFTLRDIETSLHQDNAPPALPIKKCLFYFITCWEIV